MRSRCACEHSWMQTQKNESRQCDVPPGLEQCFTVKPRQMVKWGALNAIRTRLIFTAAPRWRSCGGFNPNRLTSGETSAWTDVTRNTPLQRVHYGLHDELLRSLRMKTQAINHGEYYSGHSSIYEVQAEMMAGTLKQRRNRSDSS